MTSQLNASAHEKKTPADVSGRGPRPGVGGRRPVFAELAGARSVSKPNWILSPINRKSPDRLFPFEGVFDTADGVLNLALYLVGLAL